MKEIALGFSSLLFSGKKKSKSIYKTTHKQRSEIFKNLFTPVKINLYNFIMKSLNFAEDGNDIYQNTVLRAFKYFKNFDRSLDFKPWIFAIANNEIKRFYKKNSQFKFVDNIFNSTEFQSVEDSGKEIVQIIFSVAQELKLRERQIFFMFYDSGFNINEISEIIGIKPGNVKVILSDSRKKIRRSLGVKK